jgi:hypothetical protein
MRNPVTPMDAHLDRVQNSNPLFQPGDLVKFIGFDGPVQGKLVRIIPGSDNTWEMQPVDGSTKRHVGEHDLVKIPEAVDKKSKPNKTESKEKSKEKSKSKETRSFKKGDKVSMDGQEGTVQYAEGIEEDGYPVYHVKWKDGSRSSEASKHYKKI